MGPAGIDFACSGVAACGVEESLLADVAGDVGLGGVPLPEAGDSDGGFEVDARALPSASWRVVGELDPGVAVGPEVLPPPAVLAGPQALSAKVVETAMAANVVFMRSSADSEKVA